MTTPHFHAVIWIDHHEAKIFHFNKMDVDMQSLQPENPSMHVHHKSNTVGSGHEKLDKVFLHEVATAVASAGEVLIVGPGNAKDELVEHITRYDPKLKDKIMGVETVDHPSDGQIVAYARNFFKSADTLRLRPQ
jgi:stalled ribosome rescue protein Dom34